MKPVLLCILDGWGWRADATNNAIALAKTPTWDKLLSEKTWAFVQTSGLAVGLPDDQMGNSEVGHMNLGGGRVVMQDLPRIDAAIADGSLGKLPHLTAFIAKLKASGGTAHLMGLMSPGGVHSHQDHMVACAKILSAAGVPVAVHAFMDGRDTAPKSGAGFLDAFEKAIADLPGVSVATVSGRYFAMDRDKRWDRVKKACDVIAHGTGDAATTAGQVMTDSYAADVTDEFVLPRPVGGYTGMKAGDGVLMANFRADRAREILTALLDPAFDGFDRGARPDFAAALGMVEYSSAHNKLLPALFPSLELKQSLGEVVANAGRKQLRIAETEKYAHVTFFFNGGEEQVFPGEDRILIPSPDVATYDLQPEMSAADVTDRLVEAIGSKKYDLIVVNYANGDMVGHTGILSAAMKAAEAIDASIARLIDAIDAAGGAILITADHGNCELMVDPETGEPHTQHTTTDVPAVLTGKGAEGYGLKAGRLADIAPTLLQLMGLPQPAEMTGHSLLVPAKETGQAAIA